MQFSAVFSNAAFMGLPMMKALYGLDGVFLGSFYVVAFNIFAWTFGYAMFSTVEEDGGMKTTKSNALNPVVAVYGSHYFCFSHSCTRTIERAVNYIGDMTMPLSMLIIGSLISTVKVKELLK